MAPFADFFNLFNHAPSKIYDSGNPGLTGTFGSLNFDYANAPPGLLGKRGGGARPAESHAQGDGGVQFLF